MVKNQKTFFFFSFLPALAYWYLEENYSLQVALIGGVALAVVEMALEWIFTKHIHTITKFNFTLILFLGGISLLASEGIWFKLQPAFTGWVMGGYLIYKYIRKESLMYEIISQLNNKMPPRELLQWTERNMGIFLFVYGSFMSVVAVLGSTEQWLFWKTIGFYICFGVFSVLQTILMRFKLRRLSS